MPGSPRILAHGLALLWLLSGLPACSSSRPAARNGKPVPEMTRPAAAAVAPAPAVAPYPVMLGIDVLEAEGFAAVKGKRIGLLTHPAGVNRRGVSTIEVLRHAPGVKLVALYAVEHGLYNDQTAETPVASSVDPRTGLKVISLYSGKILKPTPAQLKDIDALVIDLQDIGTRSYTFSGGMKTAMEACFQNGKEVIVLDRPNPLGGLKVDGPPLDADLMSDVGRFRVPYVHGLTMGELARMALDTKPPGGLNLSDAARARARLTVIPMRGWSRAMTWPETGLKWVATSTMIRDFEAAEGYPMVGLGCILGGFSHGIGRQYPFRGLSHPGVGRDVLERDLRALNLPGLGFRLVSAIDAKGKPTTGIYIDITDYRAWEPTELNFYLMKLACVLDAKNPFANVTAVERRTFEVHVGSAAFFNDLAAKGKNVDIAAWLIRWREQAAIYQRESQKYWLYR